MIWVFVFGGIALAGLIMVVCYIVWLAHLTADVLSEVGVLGQRLGELGELAASIQFPDPYAVVDAGHGRSPASSGVGSEYRTYDNEGETFGRVGKRGMMTPLAIFGLGPAELLIILAIVLLLFGGSRLAGLGKSSGRALKEFKEETKGLKPEDQPQAGQPPAGTAVPPQTSLGTQSGAADPQWQQQPPATGQGPSDADLRRDV